MESVTLIPFSSEHAQWMYCRQKKWYFFGTYDSANLEAMWQEEKQEPNMKKSGQCVIPVDQGRFEVDLHTRVITSVYWKEEEGRVIRGTWFYQTNDTKCSFVPFEEDDAHVLELAWTQLLLDKRKNKRTSPPNAHIAVYDHVELVEAAKVEVMAQLFEKVDFTEADKIVKSMETSGKVQSIHRGRIIATESADKGKFTAFPETMSEMKSKAKASHLVFVIHGIGEFFCKNSNYQFPSIVDCASDVRTLSESILEERFAETFSEDTKHQFVEYIPIEWSEAIRTGEELLNAVSLRSLQFVRDITNEVLSDVLFYMERKRSILSYVIASLNATYKKYLERNPKFNGQVCIMGHSLGSVISYDLLMHQDTIIPGQAEEDCANDSWGQLEFKVDTFFAFGSPIGLFEAVRGMTIEEKKKLTCCTRVYNVYHPADPVAYRIEPLINREFQHIPPVRVETFEGGDYFHYKMSDLGGQIQDTMGNVANRVSSIFNFAQAASHRQLTEGKPRKPSDTPLTTEQREALLGKGCGCLNQGNRIDYELQSTPIQHINQIGAALWAHCAYWESKDFILFVLQQLYNPDGPAKSMASNYVDLTMD